ncbi:MAG: hypothetical protein EZS28_011517 [Streblomastix strix]|uniref:CBF1-interacting co-repressor CIR N-terminal domain-containing protein n=1 Tax=Streblomastix strix TaxID=222440 RepID=A0A5J4WF61_9EUKA|nr:MAG: hypothetical protein EZS28_011517 [Streblomastix strix]
MSNTKKYKTFLLSKKRWHVGLTANILKVKRDEAQHANEEENIRNHQIISGQEQRLDELRKRAQIDNNYQEDEASTSNQSQSMKYKQEQMQQKLAQGKPQTFKSVQETPWYCRLEDNSGKTVIAKEQ